jgi:hypothetical protein
MGPVGIIVLAGTVSYAGNVKESGTPFPSNSPKIVVGTALLAIGAGLVSGAFVEPVKWLAILMLITALVRYVPSFSTTPKKGKKNG